MMKDTITLFHYENGSYTKHVFKTCFVSYNASESFNTNGMTVNDVMNVIIATDENINFNLGYDFVLLGTTSSAIDNTSESSISTSLKQLKTSNTIYTVQACTKNLFGDLANIELTCV